MLPFATNPASQSKPQGEAQSAHRSLRAAAFAIVIFFALIVVKLYTTKAAPPSAQL